MRGTDRRDDPWEISEPSFDTLGAAVLTKLQRKRRLALRLTFLLLLLCVILLAWALLSNYRRQGEMQERLDLQNAILADLERELDDANALMQEAEPVITGETVSASIQSLQELVTKEYLYTNAGKYESHSQISISGITVGVPLTKKSFTVVYDGRVKAGIDLSAVRIDVRETPRSITVTLPASEITSHEIFEDTMRVVDEKDAPFNKNTIDDYNDFMARQKEDMENRVRGNGFLTGADQEAREIVRSMLSLLPGMDTYTLTVR